MHLFPKPRRGPRGIHPSHSELASLPLWTVMACALGVLMWNFGTQGPVSSGLHAAELESSVALAGGVDGFHAGRDVNGVGSEPGAIMMEPVRLDASSGHHTADGTDGGDSQAKATGEGGTAASGQDAKDVPGEGGSNQSGAGGSLSCPNGRDEDGKRIGMWETFHKNGQSESRGRYEDDKREGRWQSWSDSGRLVRDGAFLDGKQEGAWSGWNPDGTRRSEQYYSQGRRTGTHTLWFTNGQIKETGPYVNGLRHGPWQFYDFQGNPDLRTGTYVNGQRVTDDN